AALPPSDEPADPAARPATRSRVPTLARVAAAGVALALLAPAAVVRHGATTLQRPPTTLLVEGRVALTIPADWSTQRVVSGPGSARVQVTSPADPEVALHVTQSPVPGETLPGTAQRLKRAIDASPAGVFVDFNPSDIRAGRPAVTYREVRAGHQVRWTILLDGAVRISVGCQSGPGHEDLLREVCAQAVRSVHAVG
ncbi:type VII secretion-associated protein, partial [Mycobacterium tuberculosis]